MNNSRTLLLRVGAALCLVATGASAQTGLPAQVPIPPVAPRSVAGSAALYKASDFDPAGAASTAAAAAQAYAVQRAHQTGTQAANTIAGTFTPTQVGTGSPTSTTFLRGDGTWAGMTPGGNTVASTGNVLMGDGAGNAIAVQATADLLRAMRLRGDLSSAETPLPVNLAAPGNLTIRAGTQNADGTITIPANDYVVWTPGDTVAALHTCYVAATTDVPVGKTTGLCIRAYSHGYQNIDYSTAGEVFSSPAPGVSKYVFTNFVYNTYTDYAIYVVNSTSAPITVFPPLVTLADAGLLPVSSFADQVAVATQPLLDLDYTLFADADRSARYRLELRSTVASDSVHGNDQSAGTLYAPFASLSMDGQGHTRTYANGSVLGLYRGSLFRDSLQFSTLGTTHGLVTQDVAMGSVKALPIISGLDPVNDASFVANGNGTFSIQWTPEDATYVAFNQRPGYDNIYVVEINVATEAATPIASRRRMTDVTSSAAAVSTPGSVYITSFGNGWSGQIHPSDNLPPGAGSYRYEVVSRYCPANWGQADVNPGDGAMSGLELVGGNNGYGSLEGPPGFVGDRLVIVHATTHSAVIGGGSLQRSLFYESGASSIQLAWYTAAGAGLRWDTRHCIFYMNVGDRAANGVISHTGGTPFDRGDMSRCAFLGARWSNHALEGTAIDYVNVTTGVVDGVYVSNIRDAFGYSMPTAGEVKNSVFRAVHLARISGSFHDNLVEAQNGADPNDVTNRYPGGACFIQQTGASAVNNLFWSHADPATALNPAFISDGSGGIAWDDSVTAYTCQRNIIVLQPVATTASGSYFVTHPTSGMAVDYNLVINVAKGGFYAAGTGTFYTTWAGYVAGSGLDQHSMYVDLSSDPRGLQAVYTDPVNGDFRWAQTDVARRCAAFCKTNNVGPGRVTNRWPVVPTVDEAVRLLTDL